MLNIHFPKFFFNSMSSLYLQSLSFRLIFCPSVGLHNQILYFVNNQVFCKWTRMDFSEHFCLSIIRSETLTTPNRGLLGIFEWFRRNVENMQTKNNAKSVVFQQTKCQSAKMEFSLFNETILCEIIIFYLFNLFLYRKNFHRITLHSHIQQHLHSKMTI